MARPGAAVDTALLDELVARQVLEPFEHRNLNAEVEAFERRGADLGEPGGGDLPPV